MVYVVYVVLVVVGLSLGSFVNALVWRLHEQEHPAKKRKLKKADLSILHGRSMCPNCHHELAPADLVPLFSWIGLQGKCRYCGKPISWQYPIVEAATALLFVLSYIYWPNGFGSHGLLEFVVWLVLLVGFMALVVYDFRWFILPDRITYPLIFIALAQLLVLTFFYNGGWQHLAGTGWGVLVLGGLFYVLFQLSQGKWIGGGDVKLGALLGLVVGGPLNGILLLLLASAAGTLVALPLLAAGKLKRNSHVPFGPFLIGAAVIVALFGTQIIAWYEGHLGL